MKTVGAGIVTVGLGGCAGILGGGSDDGLDEVRKATADYTDPAAAENDGYVRRMDHAVCGMGYHFPHPEIMQGIKNGDAVDRTEPPVLVYGENSDGELLLGAVEWLAPKQGEYADGPPDLFDHEDEKWQEGPQGQGWALHAWVHEDNPEGVFNPINSRDEFSPDGCQEIGDH